MSQALTVVKTANEPSRSEQVKKLMNEAKSLAIQDVQEFIKLLAELEKRAHAIRTGGDAYKPGVREHAREIEDFCASKAVGVSSILNRL